jgi:hypothetical protein
LRRLVLVVLGVRVGFERVFDQLTGVETTAFVFGKMKLDAGAAFSTEIVTVTRATA